MKTAITTLCVGDLYEHLSRFSHPPMELYARCIGADFIVERTFGDHAVGSYQKFTLIHRLLQDYDRVCFIDSDILIRHDAPNIFQEVPEECLGLYDEGGLFDRTPAWNALFQRLNFPINPIAFKENHFYFNTGVIVASKKHRLLFIPALEEFDSFGEQSFFNYRVWDKRPKTHKLPYRFNRLHEIGAVTGEGWDDSYFAHFAGAFGKDNPSLQENVQAFESMAHRFKHYADWGIPQFRAHIRVDFQGALGDIVAGEPLIRYLSEVMYPDANLLIRCTQPEVFAHINAKVIGFQEPFDETLPWYVITPLPKNMQEPIFHITHPLDFMSIQAFKGMLPKEHRRIKLKPASEIPWDVSGHVLVHFGKTWTSKTFPPEYCKAIVDGLLKAEIPVALIGNYVVTEGLSGEGTLDLRGCTTLPEMFKVIQDAPLLISNDSSPVHICGAFDTPCILIPTCKHPDHIWPQRDPSLNIALGQNFPIDFKPNRPKEVIRVDEATAEDLLKILPSPDEVVRRAALVFYHRKR